MQLFILKKLTIVDSIYILRFLRQTLKILFIYLFLLLTRMQMHLLFSYSNLLI